MYLFRSLQPKIIAMTEREIILSNLEMAAEISKKIGKAVITYGAKGRKANGNIYLKIAEKYAEVYHAIKNNPQGITDEEYVINFLKERYQDEFPSIVNIYLQDPVEVGRIKALRYEHFRKTKPDKKKPKKRKNTSSNGVLFNLGVLVKRTSVVQRHNRSTYTGTHQTPNRQGAE